MLYFLHFENAFLELITINLIFMQNLKKIFSKMKAWNPLENLCHLRGNLSSCQIGYLKNLRFFQFLVQTNLIQLSHVPYISVYISGIILIFMHM